MKIVKFSKINLTNQIQIISKIFKLPSDEYCNDLDIEKQTLEELLTKSQSEYSNMINEKNKIIADINYQLLDFDIFKNEIKDQFDQLNNSEKEKLTLMVNDTEKLRIVYE